MNEGGFKQIPDGSRLYLATGLYCLKRERRPGEKDLVEIANSGQHEASLIFAPETSTWYNIGHEPTTEKGANGMEVRSIISYPLNLSAIGTEFTHYHTHPGFMEEIYLKSGLKAVQAEGIAASSRIKKVLGALNAIEISIPSVCDVYGYAGISECHPRCTLDFRVASPYGIFALRFEKGAPLDAACKAYREAHRQKQEIINPEQERSEGISAMLEVMSKKLGGLLAVSMQMA